MILYTTRLNVNHENLFINEGTFFINKSTTSLNSITSTISIHAIYPYIRGLTGLKERIYK